MNKKFIKYTLIKSFKLIYHVNNYNPTKEIIITNIIVLILKQNTV